MKKSPKLYVFRGRCILRTLLLVFTALFGVLCASLPINLPPSSALTNALLARGLLLSSPTDARISFLMKLALPAFAAMEKPLASEPSAAVSAAPSEPVSEPTDATNEATYQTTSQKGYTSIEGLYINNQTEYAFDIKQLLEKPLSFAVGTQPLVLIVHTHTSESYTPSPNFQYTPTDTDRTEDINFNVARVGVNIAQKLQAANIPYIHDKAINDYPSYSGSYAKTLTLIESYLEKYPSIKVVLDIHRDSIMRSDGTKMKAVCTIDNEKTAQIMLVVGTDGSGLEHPAWRDNLSFALKLQYAMNEMFPTLARPVNLRKQRFNGHTAPGAVIVEVGSDANTMEEALLGADRFSEALIEVLSAR
ncbi:MAG: stage II sporulation protein P [Clostridia bacterium]|nr:stage II sporulation protein P [Clostridia bacterium]